MMDSFKVPSVDLADFVEGDAASQARFVDALGAAFSNVGFVSVRNHGLSEDLRARIYRASQAFFALPESVKLAYHVDHSGQRGYTPFGREHAKGASRPDLKEFFSVRREIPTGHPLHAKLAGLPDDEPRKTYIQHNVWPAEISDFKCTLLEGYHALDRSFHRLLAATALFLGQPRNHFEPFIKYGDCLYRSIHYPPIIGEPQNTVRAGAHEDINLLTLLDCAGGEVAEGLQLLPLGGTWQPITSLPGHIVINVGDMLQEYSQNFGHFLRSTTHRVVIPEGDKRRYSRLSQPFFGHPEPDMPLSDGLTAGEYLIQRLVELKLIPDRYRAPPWG